MSRDLSVPVGFVTPLTVPAGAGIDVVFAANLLQTVEVDFHDLDLVIHGLALAVKILGLHSPVYLGSFLVNKTNGLLSELLIEARQADDV